jgi:hypothetical protein
VALQGTLETFSLPDVLRLLSSTKKTGCLRLSSGRGSGNVWVAEGQIVAGDSSEATHADGNVDVLFELLRFEDGEFVFEDGSEPTKAGKPADVEAVLGDAEKMLAEWKEIEAVVPSNHHWVALAASIPADEITLSADHWKAVVAVAGGGSIIDVADKLELGDLAIARLVKELSESGIVEVSEPREAVTPATPEVTAPADEAPAPTLHAVPQPREDRFDPRALVIERDEPVGDLPKEEVPGADQEVAAFGTVQTDAGPDLDLTTPAAAGEAVAPEPGEAAEIARQLANLSPKAARAVAAAAKASTPEEREAALAEVEASDDQINRDLLLKFLGTVN